jgi:hypothetical protein
VSSQEAKQAGRRERRRRAGPCVYGRWGYALVRSAGRNRGAPTWVANAERSPGSSATGQRSICLSPAPGPRRPERGRARRRQLTCRATLAVVAPGSSRAPSRSHARPAGRRTRGFAACWDDDDDGVPGFGCCWRAWKAGVMMVFPEAGRDDVPKTRIWISSGKFEFRPNFAHFGQDR